MSNWFGTSQVYAQWAQRKDLTEHEVNLVLTQFATNGDARGLRGLTEGRTLTEKQLLVLRSSEDPRAVLWLLKAAQEDPGGPAHQLARGWLRDAPVNELFEAFRFWTQGPDDLSLSRELFTVLWNRLSTRARRELLVSYAAVWREEGLSPGALGWAAGWIQTKPSQDVSSPSIFLQRLEHSPRLARQVLRLLSVGEIEAVLSAWKYSRTHTFADILEERIDEEVEKGLTDALDLAAAARLAVRRLRRNRPQARELVGTEVLDWVLEVQTQAEAAGEAGVQARALLAPKLKAVTNALKTWDDTLPTRERVYERGFSPEGREGAVLLLKSLPSDDPLVRHVITAADLSLAHAATAMRAPLDWSVMLEGRSEAWKKRLATTLWSNRADVPDEALSALWRSLDGDVLTRAFSALLQQPGGFSPSGVEMLARTMDPTLVRTLLQELNAHDLLRLERRSAEIAAELLHETVGQSPEAIEAFGTLGSDFVGTLGELIAVSISLGS